MHICTVIRALQVSWCYVSLIVPSLISWFFPEYSSSGPPSLIRVCYALGQCAFQCTSFSRAKELVHNEMQWKDACVSFLTCTLHVHMHRQQLTEMRSIFLSIPSDKGFTLSEHTRVPATKHHACTVRTWKTRWKLGSNLWCTKKSIINWNNMARPCNAVALLSGSIMIMAARASEPAGRLQLTDAWGHEANGVSTTKTNFQLA